MIDVVDPATRSRMMSGIRGKNTRPELLIRKALHARGFRYRIHCKELPGNPDLCFPKHRAVIFVHGCFWHGHDCHLFKWPASRAEFWRAKIERNKEVNRLALERLQTQGWRVAEVWECALRGRTKLRPELVIRQCEAWLFSQENGLSVEGQETRIGATSLERGWS